MGLYCTRIPGSILRSDTNTFGAASEKDTWVKNLPDPTCGATFCGDPL